jgi:hypothetical protein
MSADKYRAGRLTTHKNAVWKKTYIIAIIAIFHSIEKKTNSRK